MNIPLKIFFTVVFITSTTFTIEHENDNHLVHDEDTAWWTPYALVAGLILCVYFDKKARDAKRISAILKTPNENLSADTIVEKIKYLYENYNVSPAFNQVQALYAKGGAQAMHAIKEAVRPEDRSALFDLGFYNYDPEMATITTRGLYYERYLIKLLDDLEHHETTPEKKERIFKILNNWSSAAKKNHLYFFKELYYRSQKKITSFSNFQQITTLINLQEQDLTRVTIQDYTNFSLNMAVTGLKTTPFMWLDYLLNHGATQQQLKNETYESAVNNYFEALSYARKPERFKSISYMREVYGLLRFHYNKNSLKKATAWEKENGIINSPITLFNGYDYTFNPSSLTIASLRYNSDKKTEKPLFPPDLCIVTT